ncbi:MAG: putative Na+/H+ antiporter [Betaproteobacteria bacterium]|nr:putative Na+/H+ antiporter [Betaproteobacteria bacterium]
MNPVPIEIIGAALFGIALIHTFSTKFFERLAHTHAAHAGFWHFLGEVEVVFGFWAMVLIVAMLVMEGKQTAVAYLDQQSFTEPMFVFAIMVISGSRPILQFAMLCVRMVARLIPWVEGKSFYFVTLSFVPLLGSFITEPAAMTLAGLILLERYYSKDISVRLKYVTLGVLFVNISIGGTLTSFAAPPVLMVAGKWGWDATFMFAAFGWKAALAVIINALAATLLFQRDLSKIKNQENGAIAAVPLPVVLVHLVFLTGVVVFAHHPVIFIGLLLFFLGFAQAYERYQDRLILREGLLVAFFLAGLIVLGGQQKWWLQPILAEMDSTTLFFGATLLTAITDNAALTYLGSLLEGTSAEFRYSLVAGAVTGGGLTVIANAPNPAGFAILKGSFRDEAIHPLGLFAAAIPPTIVAILAFQLL